MRAALWFLAGVSVLVGVSVGLERRMPRAEPQFAVAYSADQARYLGLDSDETFRAILKDLRPRHVRLQANWNSVEPKPGNFDFSELDKLVGEAAAADATVTLAVGRKLPRWPECHDPAWLAGLAPYEIEERQLAMLREVVTHFKPNRNIVRWQLENEPLFGFGNCPPPNVGRLRQEGELLRELDSSRPILITDSGELSPWWESSFLADEQGVTMYQVTWDPLVGYFHYPWPPGFYRLKAALISPFVRKTLVSELQMEPWAPKGLNALSPSEASRSFDPERFWRNVTFVRATGLSEAFVWGVEWWYAQKQRGDGGYWDSGRLLFSGGKWR